jgi:hypothetical protein
MSALPLCRMKAEPSRETLGDAHRALQRLRLRNLPADLDAALADALYGPVLKGMARQLLREHAEKLRLRLPCLAFDARAAAAGDAL